eukprot:14690265-Alexandrium_andersonii.AAC.1
MLARIWARCRRSDFRAWSESESGPWDAAVVGNSALRECMTRVVQHEIWNELGISCADLYLDIEKFYDSMMLAALASAATRKGYPALPLALAMLLF